MVFNNSILLGAAAAQGGGFYPQTIEQSLKFNDDDSQYLSWTPTAAGNRTTWTWSGWVKRGNIGTTQDIFIAGSNASGQLSTQFTITSGNILQVYSTISGSSAAILLQTTQVFRDPSAWYHFTLTANTTDGTASNRVKLYVNGEQVTSFSTATYPSQNYDTAINNNVIHTLGRFSVAAANYFDGYLSDIHFIDGQALDPTSFGQFKEGVWVATSYAGSYGTNGFHLTFQDDVVSEGFNTVTYTGTGASNSVSGIGFQPDFTWIKKRNSAADHQLVNSVVGYANGTLLSNQTDAEYTAAARVDSQDADGFTVSSPGQVNADGDTYVAWNWDAGENNAPTGHSSVTYTGNGGTQSIKGLGFEPDLVWIKERNDTTGSYYHCLMDSVRGGTKPLFSNVTNAEATESLAIQSFDADGWTMGSWGGANESGKPYVGWCWDAGSGSPVSNTDGSITSSVKANPSYGFSVVSWSGSSAVGTIGHGLSAVP
jgi:hypothetical protein